MNEIKEKRQYLFKTTHKAYHTKYEPNQVYESILFFDFDEGNYYKAVKCLEHVNGCIRLSNSPEKMDNTWLARILPKKMSYKGLMRRVKNPSKFQITERFHIYKPTER